MSTPDRSAPLRRFRNLAFLSALACAGFPGAAQHAGGLAFNGFDHAGRRRQCHPLTAAALRPAADEGYAEQRPPLPVAAAEVEGPTRLSDARGEGAESLHEDDDQRGFAHLAEHMAFNGTTHF